MFKNNKISNRSLLEQIIPNRSNSPLIYPNNPPTSPIDKNIIREINKPDWDPNLPDWTPNFNNNIDIVENSLNLALFTLNISKAEYNSYDMIYLIKQKNISNSMEHIWALNILIFHKNKYMNKFNKGELI